MEGNSDDLRELRNRRRQAQLQIKKVKADIHNLLEKTLIPEAKAECQKLAALFYTKLPRELRDAVYTYLCVGKKPIIVDGDCLPHYNNTWFGKRGNEYGEADMKDDDGLHEQIVNMGQELVGNEVDPLFPLVRIVDGAMKSTGLPADAIFDPEYVGAEVWREAVEMYYSANCFDFPQTLGVFPQQPKLTIDNVQIVVDPLVWLRKLRICIRILVHNDLVARRRYKDDLASLEERLAGIYQLKPRENLRVEVMVMSDLTLWHTVKESDRRRGHFRGVIERVRTVLGDSRNKIMENVTVIHHKTSWNGLLCRDITRLFSVPDDEFNAMVDVLLK
ncbi:hypothetical protein P154DRAFT_104353 [Amniculicola lignicola CBS 123094]|uniref:Uncharacterized protein n=1 Tax=Amniculicola lignicola CBS 123094 TaxID=1392246 RepID=A0A6A5WNA7_9PLEO|nr:hypothetical protein P154DRAFT_104353 [Amniculicola lignicola CBS 123094]